MPTLNAVVLAHLGNRGPAKKVDQPAGVRSTKLFNTRKWSTVEQLSVAMADYIDDVHKTRRRHSAPDMFTPTEFEIMNKPQSHHA